MILPLFSAPASHHSPKTTNFKKFPISRNAFDQLPLACLVGGQILCVHGGVGDGRWDLNDLRVVRRPLSGNELGCSKLRWVHNILWSDPIEAAKQTYALTDSMRHAPFFFVKKTLGHHNKSKILRRKHKNAKGPKEITVYSEDSGFFYGFSLLLKKNTFDIRTTWNNAPMKSRVQCLEFMKVLEIQRPYCLDGISLRLFVHEMDWPWSCEAINPRNMALVLI